MTKQELTEAISHEIFQHFKAFRREEIEGDFGQFIEAVANGFLSSIFALTCQFSTETMNLAAWKAVKTMIELKLEKLQMEISNAPH